MISIVVPVTSRFAPARLAAGLALVALAILTSAGAASAAVGVSSAQACQATTITAFAEADAWVLENSTSNMGGDSHLLVEAKPGGNSRALVRFLMPDVPSGCIVESARLRLYVSSGSDGARAEAVRLASTWSEGSVIWTNQPAPTGPVATAWSSAGYMPWNVTSQVQSIYSTGANHGFLIRHAAEGTELGSKHDFSSREGGNQPELVIRFAAPPTGDPPAPPMPANVFCGDVLTQSTLVINHLSGCPGDGLVIGAPRIIVDLNGFTIAGTGPGSGILNDGYAGVTVRNGTVQDFAYGVRLLPESSLNVVEGLTLLGNEEAGIELGTVADTQIRDNTLHLNGAGIGLVNGTTRTTVARNTITASEETGIVLRYSDDNWLQYNSVDGRGFESTLPGSGILLEIANRNEVRGNDVHFNVVGIHQLEGSQNVIVANNASNSTEHGIALEAEVGDLPGLGNRVEGNAASANGADGIFAGEMGGHTIIANVARNNAGWGINALLGNIDGGRNVATGNGESEECFGVVCSAFDTTPPETTITSGPAATTTASSATFTFSSSEPGSTFECSLDTAAFAACTSPQPYTGLAIGGHEFRVRATDSAGLVDATPAGHSWTILPPDTTPPQTTLTAKAKGSTITFTFSASEAGSTFQCALDTAAFAACTSPRVVSGLPAGAHQFSVRAIDPAGNVDPTPASRSWTIRR